jgi:hypothetical protein
MFYRILSSYTLNIPFEESECVIPFFLSVDAFLKLALL